MSKIEWTDIIKRFWSYVKIGSSDDCWEWQAGLFQAVMGSFAQKIRK